MGFKERLKKAKKTEGLFIEWCIKEGISYAYSGYEKLKQSSKFRDVIQKLDTITAKRIRYYPDLYITGKKAWLTELKNSIYIEKDSYLTLIELMKASYSVALINIIDNKLLTTKIEDVHFKSIGNNFLPHNNIWIYPRNLNEETYLRWKENHLNASGAPYGIIDYKNSESTILIKDIRKFEEINNEKKSTG